MYRICFPLFDRMLLTGVSGPTEMWQAAEKLVRSRKAGIAPIEIATVSDVIAPIEAVGGLRIMADRDYKDSQVCDLIVLAPIWGNPRYAVRHHEALRQWLVTQHQQGAKIIATGTSVCFLAEQGLLDGLDATTHWYYFEHFRRFYPQVNLNTHQFITYSDGLYCAGSINALSDLVLYLIRERYGDAISRVVEQHFSHEINRTFDKPFFTKGGHQHHDEDIIAAQEWALQHWRTSFTQAVWSAEVGLSERTFGRRFKQVTGLTPLVWVRHIRLDKARELLRATNLPVGEIAESVGFHDTGYFSRLFDQFAGMSPQKYRVMVRDKLFSAQTSDS